MRGKLLVFSLALSVITTILWIAAFSTNHWVHWEFPEGGLYRPSKKVYLEKQNSGVWKMCRVERDQNNEKHGYCDFLQLFPNSEELKADPESDATVINYRRSCVAIGIIGILVLALANTFVYYSTVQLRYIYKRLSGCLLIGGAVCILVCVEIFHGTVEYEKNNLPAKYPAQAKHKFGFCFGLSWFCIAMLIISGVILFVYSRKQKDELVEDRPVIIGRI